VFGLNIKGNSYTWDFENRLVSAVVPGTGTVTYKYDPFGRRVYKNSPNFAGVFAYDGYNLIETTTSNGVVVARYTQTQNIDEPVAAIRSGTASYYETNGLGSITSISGSAGTISNTYTYDAFGNVTNFTGSLSNPFGYNGREYDEETGLDYYRARYYDSTTGRFISEDSIRFGGGNNFYSYVGNNPTNLTDPLGLRSLTPEQCRQLREVLMLEEEYGTFVASLKANITFNSHGILADFNSQNTDYEPIQTAQGPINLDWFATLEVTSGAGLAYFDYGWEKLGWIIIRHVYKTAPPVTNNTPYSAPDERNAAWQVTIGKGYEDLFTPEWMSKNCPCRSDQ